MKIKTLVVFLILILCSSYSFARSSTSLTLFERAEASDAVLDAVVMKATNHKARGRWKDEPYSVLHLEGSIVTGNGEQPINGRYLLRVPVIDNSADIVGSRFLFFISRNGEKTRPFVKGDMTAGMINIDSAGYLVGPQNTKYADIDREGSLVFEKRFNSCTIDDAPDLYGDEKNENGATMRVYSREELLVNLNSFECPDGNQWWRGNDKPQGYVQKSLITIEEVKNRISKHLAILNVQPTNLSKFKKLPPGIILNPKNSLEFLESTDRITIDLMREVKGYAATFSDKALSDIYAREKIRGRENKFPRDALDIVNEINHKDARKAKGD